MRPFLIFLAFCILSMLADAVTLQVRGHSTGQGLQNLSFTGDLLNVSLWQNGSGWNISLLGGLP